MSVFSGYKGENCQVDEDECAQYPCENDGECFQRSDVENYGTLPELTAANFSYEEAAGFICHCQPGFTGKQARSNPFDIVFSETWFGHICCCCRRQLLSQRGRVCICSMSAWRKLPGFSQLVSMFVLRWLHRYDHFYITFSLTLWLYCSLSTNMGPRQLFL